MNSENSVSNNNSGIPNNSNAYGQPRKASVYIPLGAGSVESSQGLNPQKAMLYKKNDFA